MHTLKRVLVRALVAAALTIGLVSLTSLPATAATTRVVGAAASIIAFTLPWPLLIGLLVSTILPLLVGIVTKSSWDSGVKAIILAALAAATGLLSELGAALTTGTTYDLGTGILAALAAFLVAVGLHFGIYKPTGVAGAAQSIGNTDKSDNSKI